MKESQTRPPEATLCGDLPFEDQNAALRAAPVSSLDRLADFLAESIPGQSVYLAQPYISPDKDIIRRRVALGATVLRLLMRRGMVAYSPINHGAGIPDAALISECTWYTHGLQMMRKMDAVLVLGLPQWRESLGVGLEWNDAHHRKQPLWLADLGQFS